MIVAILQELIVLNTIGRQPPCTMDNGWLTSCNDSRLSKLRESSSRLPYTLTSKVPGCWPLVHSSVLVDSDSSLYTAAGEEPQYLLLNDNRTLRDTHPAPRTCFPPTACCWVDTGLTLGLEFGLGLGLGVVFCSVIGFGLTGGNVGHVTFLSTLATTE